MTSDQIIKGTVEIDRADGMSDAEWERGIDTLTRGWLLVAGADPELDLVSVESVPDHVAKMRYPMLHKGAMPHLVEVTYRGRSTVGFTVSADVLSAPPPVATRPRWDLVLLGLSIGLVGSAMREFADGDLFDATFLGLVSLVLLGRAAMPRTDVRSKR